MFLTRLIFELVPLGYLIIIPNTDLFGLLFTEIRNESAQVSLFAVFQEKVEVVCRLGEVNKLNNI